MHFQWFWPSHASHSIEEIMKIYGNPCIFNDLGLSTLPTPPKRLSNMYEIHAFSMILGFPRSPLHRRNHFQWCWARPCSPLHHRSHEKCIEIQVCFWVGPCSPLHQRNHEKCMEIYVFLMINSTNKRSTASFLWLWVSQWGSPPNTNKY